MVVAMLNGRIIENATFVCTACHTGCLSSGPAAGTNHPQQQRLGHCQVCINHQRTVSAHAKHTTPYQHRGCTYPQELVLELDQPYLLSQIQLLSHEHKVCALMCRAGNVQMYNIHATSIKPHTPPDPQSCGGRCRCPRQPPWHRMAAPGLHHF